MNFQDVIRNVYDQSGNQLRTTGGAGNATIFAVVNTGAATDSTNNIGFATVAISNPTLYAVVNTQAAGQASVVVAPSSNYIGLVTATVSNFANSTIYAVVNTGGANTGNITLNPSPNFIGIVTVANQTGISGNVTLNGSPNYIGLTTTTIASAPTIFAVVNTSAVGQSSVVLDTGKNWIGLATVNVSNSVGNATLNPSPNFIGLTTTVIGSAPTIYAVVNTSAAGQASVVLDVGTKFIGVVTAYVSNFANSTIYAVVNTSAAGQSSVVLDTGTKNIGSVSVLGGSLGLNAGVNSIGFASVTPVMAWPDPKTYIGLVTITGSLSAAAGNVTLDPGSFTGIKGNITISPSVNWIGFATVDIIDAWTDPKTYIGLVTATLDGARGVGIVGNITITDSKSYIGLTTTTIGNNSVQAFGQFFPTLQSVASGGLGPIAIDNFGRVQAKLTADPNSYIGLTTAYLANQPALVTSTANIGSVSVLGGTINAVLQSSTLNVGSVSVLGGSIGLNAGVNSVGFATVQVASIAAGVNYIGFATVQQVNQPALVASTANIGSVSVLGGSIAITGNITISDSKTFIGLVTANTLNSGTNKTLLTLPIAFNVSISTIAVPATNLSVKVTNMILSSDATVTVRIKSGVTYLTGNASLGLTLFPGGGFAMQGSPDSPSWIGLPSGALIFEKNNITTNVGGHVVYFAE